MIGLVLDWIVRQRLRAMQFPHQRGAKHAERTARIIGCFSRGASTSLRRRDLAATKKIEAQIPLVQRFFFWEGFAFGLAARRALRLDAVRADDRRLIDHYRAMHYTGYGFWNGLASAYHLPQLPFAGDDWAASPDHERLHPLLAGGYTFAITCLHGSFDDEVLSRVAATFPETDWRRGALHGCGRALWFLYMNDADELERILRRYPEARDELAEGVGVAIGFTSLEDPDSIVRTLEGFEPETQRRLLRGIAVCLHQGIADEPGLAPIVAGITDSLLRHAYEACGNVVASVPAGPEWYLQCGDRLRAALG